MDARKYASKYVKPDNVRDGPIQTRIINVFEDERYGRLMLELEIGSQFALNDGNTNTLIKAWGHDTDDWIGLELALELGTYKDWNADPPEEKETVRVRAISPARTAAERQCAGEQAAAAEQGGRRRQGRYGRRNSVLMMVLAVADLRSKQETDRATLSHAGLQRRRAPQRIRCPGAHHAERGRYLDRHRRRDRATASDDDGKYTESEMQEFGQAARAEGRGGNQDRPGAREQRQRQWSPHAAEARRDGGILPRAARSIEGR